MNRIRSMIPYILVCAILCLPAVDALAKRPSYSNTDQCLSKRTLYRLAKNSLQELQAIDSSVTLTDVKNILRTTGDCVTIEEVNTVLEQYNNELLAASKDNINIVNTTPTINGVPETAISEGAFYNFMPSAYDPDGDALNFSITNLPHWASFNTSTGAVYGTPTATDIGQYQNILITVSDGQTMASLSGFDLEVLEVPVEVPINPLAHQITGYTIYMGTAPDALALQTTLDTGSDLGFSAELMASDTFYFSIIAHDINGDNIFLTNQDLSGYRVYAGTTSDSLYPVKDLSSEAGTLFQVSGLYTGTFFLSIAAMDVNGNEGPKSSIAQLVLM
jgi:hypothetical protein